MFWKKDPNKKYKTIAIKLDNVGKGFCLAKWHHVSMHLHTGDNHSCYHPSMHRVSLEELEKNPSALHNSEFKKQQRKTMLEGGRPDECSYCWAIEDLPGNHISDRHLRSLEFEENSPSIDQVSKLDWQADVYPRYLEINFGSECQMKCAYCAPSISTAWESEIRKHGDYPLVDFRNRMQYHVNNKKRDVWIYKEEGNPYIDAFWKWFPDAYPNLQTLRVTGGEPLLSRNVFKVLEYIDANPRPDLQFSVNSNMSIPERNLNKFIEFAKKLKAENKVKEFMLYTSVDTWGSQAEYIRNGMDLAKWESNIDKYLNEVPDSYVGLMITVNFLSIPNFHKLLDKILELRKKYNTRFKKRISFDTPYLLEPCHLSLQILDDERLAMFNDALTYMKKYQSNFDLFKFTNEEVAKVERVVRWVEQNRFKDSTLLTHRKDFQLFIDEHDKRRGTNFLETFPELTDFYNLCKSIN